MPTTPNFDTTAAHKYFAAHCFNSSWPLIDKAERSSDEELQLVALGHASLWHWMQRSDCTDTKLSVAHWLLSRIYSVLRDPVQARRYAESCLEISRRPGVEPFYLAFAYEAVARAASIGKDWVASAMAVQEARALTGLVSDSENQRLLMNDLATIQTTA